MKRSFIIVILAFANLISYAQAADNPPRAEPHSIRQIQHSLLAPEAVQHFHADTDAPQWDNDDIGDLRHAISASAKHGLNPHDYHQKALAVTTINDRERSILATDAYFALAKHLLDGKVDPKNFQANWKTKDRSQKLQANLRQALEQGEIAESLETLAPQQDEYLQLQQVLSSFSEKTKTASWASIPQGPAIKPGMRSERVALLRQRLLDDEADEDDDHNVYDESLQKAVQQFQKDAKLKPDGIVGSETLKKLNIRPKDQLDSIRVNMERWRWLPADLGRQHLRVSIANYTLEAHNHGTVSRRHDVVVGKTYRQTPSFSANMTHMVLNPWWVVPRSLAVKDLLPKFQQDVDVIAQKRYQIRDESGEVIDASDIDWDDFSETDFPFEVRQKPGKENALGRVKFIFPNEFYVYLHDTPSQYLFDKTQRDFSSGCIRVQNPMSLAGWILDGNDKWSAQRLKSAVNSGEETTITLSKPLPVHLVYWTVIVEQGSLQFPADVYDRDAKVLAGLNTPPPDE